MRVMKLQSRDPDRRDSNPNPLSVAFGEVRYALRAIGLFSLAMNVLMLTGPLFMLQVYDRVLASRSVPTLVALFGLVVVLYAFFALFDFFRTRALSRIGHWLDTHLAQPVFRVWVANGSGADRPINELTILRNFMSSQGLPALFDLPWAPIYLAIVFLLHVDLGLLALAGMVLVVAIALVSEIRSRRAIGAAIPLENRESKFADECQSSAEAILAMGMVGQVARHWMRLREMAKQQLQSSAEATDGLASSSKALRFLLQSSILGLGAYLAIRGEISPGTIVAASILAGRALSPIDQTIGNWRNISRARQAYFQLSSYLARTVDQKRDTALPAPKGHLEVNNMLKLATTSPGADDATRRPILYGFNFSLKPGDVLGVIGASGAGKSTLARALVGLVRPDQGSVRLDGATYDQWDPDVLGQYIGFLPQTVSLLPGTLRENIARFDPEADDEEVISAAELASAHELILQLPNGYDTQVGPGQPPLSGGQVQRIALARALFRRPKLIVLDEPNAHLDFEGENALKQAIATVREAGSTVVVTTHRPGMLTDANLMLLITQGQQTEFGGSASVLRKVIQPISAKAQPVPASGSPSPSSKTTTKSAESVAPTSKSTQFQGLGTSLTVPMRRAGKAAKDK
jgi:ATP-binding cassette, subfamily C, type I secretion system permease/ATPase